MTRRTAFMLRTKPGRVTKLPVRHLVFGAPAVRLPAC